MPSSPRNRYSPPAQEGGSSRESVDPFAESRPMPVPIATMRPQPTGASCCCCIPAKAVNHTCKLALVLFLVVLVMLFVQYMDRHNILVTLEWLKENPIEGSVAFVLMYSLGVVILLPGSLLSMGAGAVYGLGLGTLLTWVSTIVGQTLAFLLGRYLLRDIVVDFTYSKYPKWGTIDQALAREGFKLVSLLRLSPVMPYNVLNYILSITGIGFMPFTLASAITCFPWVVTFVYFGSLVSTLADIADGTAGPDRQTTVMLGILSVVLFVVAGWYTAIVSRQAIRKALADSGSTPSDLESLGLISSTSQDIEPLLIGDPPSAAPPHSPIAPLQRTNSIGLVERCSQAAALRSTASYGSA